MATGRPTWSQAMISRAAPATAAGRTEVWRRAFSTPSVSAKGSSPVQGPGRVAKTSGARRPENSQMTGSLTCQPRPEKYSR